MQCHLFPNVVHNDLIDVVIGQLPTSTYVYFAKGLTILSHGTLEILGENAFLYIYLVLPNVLARVASR